MGPGSRCARPGWQSRYTGGASRPDTSMSLRALLFRRPPDPQLIEIAFDGAIYPIQLRRHRQARRYTLRVQAASRAVVLTMPVRGSVKEARAFAERNGGWIAARLKRLPQPIPFADGLELPLRGMPHRVVHRAARGIGCGRRFR